MASFTILHLADLHIDSPLRGLEADPGAPAETIRGATREALIRAVAFAIERRVALVLIAGDLFDGDWNDWRTGHFLVAQLSLLARAGIPVVAIRGNHDADNVITRALPPIDGMRMLRSDRAETIIFQDLGLAVHGQSFATREMFGNLAANYPAVVPGVLNVGVLHTSATGREGHTNYAPCTPEQLRAHGYDYWALGHIHQREVLATDPWIVFPGNLQGPAHQGRRRQGRNAHPRSPTAASRAWSTFRSTCCVGNGSLSISPAWWILKKRSGSFEMPAPRRWHARVDDCLFYASCLPAPRRLMQHSAAMRVKRANGLRAELLTLGGQDVVWLEGVRILTRGAADLEALRARSDAIAELIGAIESEDGASLGDEPGAYATTMLERLPGLKEQLGPEHPAVQVAAGTISPELLARARDLLLARLAEG